MSVESSAIKVLMREWADAPLVFEELPEWLQEAIELRRIVPEFRSEDYWYYRVETPHGSELAAPGDWIAHNVLDELYVLDHQPIPPRTFWNWLWEKLGRDALQKETRG